MKRLVGWVALAGLCWFPGLARAGELTVDVAEHFAGLALKCSHQEYPNKLDHIMGDALEVQQPKQLHPAFYGCFDWHSSVHGHWMLVRLLKRFPGLPSASKVRTVLGEDLSAEAIAGELAYLKQKNRKTFERTYGWAWLLKLAQELHGWDDPDARLWEANLAPLTGVFVRSYLEFLPKQTYPIRVGVHQNTAFGLSLALDYAKALGDTALEKLLKSRARSYFEQDRSYPLMLEPGGEDFLSPALVEADLMWRVLPPAEFGAWASKFFSGFKPARLKNILTPATVTDRTDAKLVHLDGLNLSRAWCMRGIAASLPIRSSGRKLLEASALLHEKAGLAHVASGNYEGEHWLATFAVYLSTLAQKR